MKTIAIIGGNKAFYSYLVKVLKLLDVEVKFFTKYAVKNETYYDYVVFNSSSNIKDVLINGGYCFVNMESIGYKNNNVNIYGNLITYGLGSKNTVTVSSMEDNNSFVYCLQRELNYNALERLEPQELPVTMNFNGDDEIYAAMVGITIGLIEGKDIGSLNKGKKLTIFS
ncbi:hypothetical protein N4T77_11955 [Clostridium sp. CX1]|uniref:Uncharacterized protein n=1 Tax=Clostridium tanneri TaxID=3037988 RepID=A0ABU4JTK6_9CLOT|nr:MULTISPECIES: hypothetical protein [unclassified Clostridium]MCT8977314.1 hypothetical protein [Clostridium sp. CX1]MDW8801269.1 hypothetical protein [Clostridium sp. A1-XYC3]